MECEICGKTLPETNPIKAKIEGSVMVVCKECSKLGKVQKEPPKPKFVKQTNPKKQRKPKTNNKRNYRRRDEPQEELIEDYNIEIRQARESKKWSREDLAGKINERVSVINRIETGKMTPDNKLTKKLENALDIILLEKIDSVDLNEFINSQTGERTLGNIMKIKRK